MNTWLFMVHASLLACLLTTILWLPLVLLSMLRIRRTKSEGVDAPFVPVKADTGVSGIGWPIVLLITGSSLGLLIVVGNTVLLGVFAIGCSIIPWYRIRLCRERPVRAGLIMCAGGAIVVATCRHYVGFMFLPIAAWALGVAALCALLGTRLKPRMDDTRTDEERMPSKRNTTRRSPAGPGREMPSTSPRTCPPRYRQGGAFAIMAVPLLLLMIGICALALDLGQIYNRNVDLNGFARNIALAAAHELNGTSAGIAAARAKARATAESLKYEHFNNGIPFTWSDAALTFSTDSSRTGTWVDGSSPSGLYFAKVDTSALDPAAGQVDTLLIWILSPSLSTVQLSDSAVAGRKQISVTPIGICAMDPTPAVARTNTGAPATELVEYGFRRGISYDLMQLNPNGTSPVRYLINPVIAPGVSSSTFDTSVIGPFVCTGAMWVPRLSGGAVRVSPLPSTSPLADLYTQLNTRFDDFSSLQCGPYGAPPDYNIKAYAYGTSGGAPWMVPTTGSAAAVTTTSRSKLETIADLPSPPAGTTAGSYGPLWTFAKAARYPSYVSLGSPEPATGYATFSASDWTNLYKLGPTASGYPSTSTPYAATSGTSYTAPGTANRSISTSRRRVLNIPLLSCPVPAGSNAPATVLGIGKFFMTVPATADTLVAEFAGTLAEQSISTQVEIYQ